MAIQDSSPADAESRMHVVDGALMMKVFYVFGALALLSAAISVAGAYLGQSISMAGHTDDRSVREVVLGNNVVVVPANMVRFERARVNGVASRLDLYLRWPQLDGYSEGARDAFNHVGGSREIIFLSLEERIMSRDMSGRFKPIYRGMIETPGVPGPAGTTIYAFNEKSGYVNEVLAVAEQDSANPFAARCLTGPSAEESLATCQRDVHIGDNLSLSYRFPREFLGDWQRLDAAVAAKIRSMMKTGR